MGFEFRRLTEHDPVLGEALGVIRAAFAVMEGRIDPLSSLGDLTSECLSQSAAQAEVWVGAMTAFDPVAGTVILTPKDKVLFVGKLAVREHRMRLGRAVMALAEAGASGFGWLELQSRVELVEVNAMFKALGFREVGRTTHEGYVLPTSILFHKVVG